MCQSRSLFRQLKVKYKIVPYRYFISDGVQYICNGQSFLDINELNQKLKGKTIGIYTLDYNTGSTARHHSLYMTYCVLEEKKKKEIIKKREVVNSIKELEI